ncbi:hypothetical protein [Paracoccus sp. R86501]|uniref:hypothetical protein n=1 Tax=Paracoccus sp. R86501 TaxID=3101711 RepID=UPI003671E886
MAVHFTTIVFNDLLVDKMSASISRRRFLGMTAATVFLPCSWSANAGPLAAGAAWVAKKLAVAAADHFREQLLSQMFGSDAEPTNTNVIDAIRESTKELKAFVSADIRAALTEQKINDLTSSASAIHEKMTTYSRLSSADRRHYSHLLEDSDNEARNGLASADALGAAGIVSYSIFGSLRIPIEVALFERSRSTTAYKAFAGDLVGMSEVVFDKLAHYLAGRSPTGRMSGLNCANKEEGGQFPTDLAWCDYTLDGQTIRAAEGLVVSDNGIRFIRQTGQDVYNAKWQQVTGEHQWEQAEYAQPLYDGARKWVEVANEIDGELNGQVPTFSR